MHAFFILKTDVAVQNACLLNRQSNGQKKKPLDFLGFWQEIVNVYQVKYSARYKVFSKNQQRKVTKSCPTDVVRHYLLSNANQKRFGNCGKKPDLYGRIVRIFFILIALKDLQKLILYLTVI